MLQQPRLLNGTMNQIKAPQQSRSSQSGFVNIATAFSNGASVALASAMFMPRSTATAMILGAVGAIGSWIYWSRRSS